GRAHLPRRRRRLVVLAPPAGGVGLCPPVGGGALGQRLFQTLGILKSVFRALRQTAEDDPFQVARHVGPLPRRRHHLVAGVGDDYFQRVRPFERRAAAEQGGGDAAPRGDVAAGVGGIAAPRLLGGHEQRRAPDGAFLRPA